MRRRVAKAAVVALASIGLATAGAVAANATLFGHSGSALTHVQTRTQDVAWAASTATNPASTWIDVPGASVTETVASGTTRFHIARFTAEVNCGGTGGWCPVRVVRVNLATGSVTELQPVSAMDFAFDSVGGEPWESNAVERTGSYVGAGRYTFKVQAAYTAGATSIRLDDWAFEVNAYRS